MKLQVEVKYQGDPIWEAMATGKKPIREVVNKEYRPNYHVMALIGRQIINAYQGYQMLTRVKFYPNGLIQSSNYGRYYPRGIFRGVEPGGKTYTPLAKSTIAWKRRQGSRYAEQPLRMRPLGDPNALVNNLTYYVTSNNQGVNIGFRNAETNRISVLHENGVPGKRYHDPTSGFTKGNKPGAAPMFVEIPRRRHRGVQPAVGPVIRRIMRAWIIRHPNYHSTTVGAAE